MARDDLPVLAFPSAQAWETWLVEHADDSPGVWLKLAKKGCPTPSVTYAEAVRAALRFGWVDSKRVALDAQWFLQRFTRRGPRSPWSAINREAAERLMAEGLMEPAGLAAVKAAKANGRWDSAYAGQRTATVPDDLQAALDAEPAAAEFFATLTGVKRYAVLYRVQDAKRPETRARRIEQFVQMLARGQTLNP